MLTNTYLAPGSLSADYIFDGDLIYFNNTNPQLKITRPDDLVFWDKFDSSFDAKYSRDEGDLTRSLFGGAGIANGKLVVDVGHYADYAGLNNVSQVLQTGCVRVRIIPQYSGFPSSPGFVFSINRANADYRNLIDCYHDSDGTLNFRIYDKDATLISLLSFSFNPVYGTEYEFEYDFDITAGMQKVFQGGTLKTSASATGVRDSNIGLLRLSGAYVTGFSNLNMLVDDILIFDTVQHTANYTPQELFDYSTDKPSIKASDVIQVNKIVSLVANVSIIGNTDLRFVVIVNGNDYFFDTDAQQWLTSDDENDSNQYNSVTQEQFALLNLGEISSVNIKWLPVSDGNSTPTLFSYTLNYLGYGFTNLIGYLVNADGTFTSTGKIIAKPTALQSISGEAIVVNIKQIETTVDAANFGKWLIRLLTGVEYAIYIYDDKLLVEKNTITLNVSGDANYVDFL